MGWLETISSVLGTGTTGATVAVTIYTGSIWLEHEMRNEAKADIARFINNTAIAPDSHAIANFILSSFETIFGRKHWTWRCLRRSILASCVFLFIFSLTV